MIISVSMNPSVDKIIRLADLRPGYMNRVISSNVSAGGKGINVANVLAVFTEDVVLTGFVGDTNSEVIGDSVKKLEERGVTVEFVKISGRNRTNVKVLENSGRLTEINEPGFSVTDEEVDKLKAILMKYAQKENTFILTGSLPNGVDNHFYGEITKELKEKGATVYVDASGEALKNAVDAKPDMIKPNQEEILALFSEKSVSEKLLINMARELCDKGIETVIVSRGSLGSLFVTKDTVVKCDAIKAELRSAVGAGDSMVATFAYGKNKGLEYLDCIKLCVAAATYTVTLDSSYLTDKTKVEELTKEVKTIYL